jgi:hypothetical protein
MDEVKIAIGRMTEPVLLEKRVVFLAARSGRTSHGVNKKKKIRK